MKEADLGRLLKTRHGQGSGIQAVNRVFNELLDRLRQAQARCRQLEAELSEARNPGGLSDDRPSHHPGA